MRTMLIPIILVLICSQYETAGGIAVKDCGGEQSYYCYVPSMCLPDDVDDVAQSRVAEAKSFKYRGGVEIPDDFTVPDNCPVLFRYYPYTPRWMHVEMEFLAPIKSGEKNVFTFRQTKSDLSTIKNVFSCEIKGNQKKATRTKSLADGPKNMIDTPGTETDTKKCVFDVRSSEKDIFDGEQNDRIFIDVEKGPKKETTIATKKRLSEVMCDPEKLKFYPNSTTLKVYSKVQYTANNPGKYYCDNDKIFKMEFRPKLENNLRGDYEEVDSKGVVCKLGDYFINEPANDDKYKPFYLYEPVHIRCVADAKYFCNYNIRKMTGKRGLVLTSSKPESQLESKLECPKGSSLVLRGKVIDKPKIECLDYENAQYWTLKTGDRTHLLTPDFADAYCTDELKCNQKAEDKIRLVEQGSVDHNGLPKCPSEGKLQIDGKEINAPTCNMKTGKFEYTFMEGGGAPQVADSQTKFFCYLKPKNDDAADRQRALLMAGAGIVSIIVVVLIVVGTNVLVFFISRKRMEALKAKKAELEKEKRQQNMNDGVFMKYCYTEAEKNLMDEGYNPDKLVLKTKFNAETKKMEEEYEYEMLDVNDVEKPHVEAGIRWGNVVMDHVSRCESKFKDEVVDAPEPDFVENPEWETAYKKRLIYNAKKITNPLYKMPELRRVKPGDLIKLLNEYDPSEETEEDALI